MEIFKFLRSFMSENRYALILMTVIFFAFFRSESDSWWLLKAGESIWHGDFPTRDTWSYTAHGNYWPNHEFAFEALLYVLWRAGFGSFIVAAIFFSLLTTLALILNYPSEKLQQHWAVDFKKIDRYIWLIVALLGTTVAALRPNAVSIVFFSLLIFFIAHKKYKPIVILFFLWANFHAGFIVGAAFLGLTFLLTLFQYMRARTLDHASVSKKFFLTGVASFAVTFANPLGYNLWLYILESFNKPTVGVREFLPLWEAQEMLILFAGALFLSIPFIFSKRKLFASWEAQVLLLAFVLTGLLTLFVVRFWFFFVIAAIPLILAAYSASNSKSQWKESKLAQSALALITIAGLTYGISVHWHARTTPLEPEIITALDECSGNTFNNYESGAYLIWLQDNPVFIDNRFDPYSSKLKEFTLLDKADPWEEVFGDYSITCALINSTGSEAKVLSDAGWTVKLKAGDWAVLSAPKA